MALNSSGPISLAGTTAGQSIEIELGGNGTTQISLNDASVRTLAGVPSGAIVMPTNFYGKSNRVAIALTISANTQNYNIFSNKGGTYVAGKSDITVTINSGVVVGSSTTGGFGMDTGTGWTSGDTIKIVNNGYIVGCGGNGGSAPSVNVTNGTAGGTALRFQYATQVQNNSIIGGGGGGGGSGIGDGSGAGTGGQGAGNSVGSGYGTATTTTGGSTPTTNNLAGLAGGGPGAAGASGDSGFYFPPTPGGGGGGLGASGGTGYGSSYFGIPGGVGGGGGAATSGSGTYATWLATGTRYGSIG